MIASPEIVTDIMQPRTLEEFMLWESNDGFKYEWHDGELIKIRGNHRHQLCIFDILINHFIKQGYFEVGILVSKQDVKLSAIQMRRPDIAYFTRQQVLNMKEGIDEIPEFAIEIISDYDQINLVKKKITEYFKYGVKVVWVILSEEQQIEVYTSRKDVKICTDHDICSAKPVLEDFEISVNEIFG
jgi:Uma2 family endonuclease